MKAQTYNPYKAKAWPIDRFRGIVNPENQQTIAKEYVGSSDNLVSFRLGEITAREGQIKDPGFGAKSDFNVIANGDFQQGLSSWVYNSGITLPLITSSAWWTGSQITISGAGTVGANGVYTFSDMVNGKPEFGKNDRYYLYSTGTKWIVVDEEAGALYQQTTNEEWPWLGAYKTNTFDYSGTSIFISNAPDERWNGEYLFSGSSANGYPEFAKDGLMGQKFIQTFDFKYLLIDFLGPWQEYIKQTEPWLMPWEGEWKTDPYGEPRTITISSLPKLADWPPPARPSTELAQTGTSFWDGLSVTVEGPAGTPEALGVYVFSNLYNGYPRFRHTTETLQFVQKAGNGTWSMPGYGTATVSQWPWEQPFFIRGIGVNPAPTLQSWVAPRAVDGELKIYVPRGTQGTEAPLILQEILGAKAGVKYICSFSAKFAVDGAVFRARINNWNGSTWDWGTTNVNYGMVQQGGAQDWTDYSMEITPAFSTKLRFLFAPDVDKNGGDGWIKNISVKTAVTEEQRLIHSAASLYSHFLIGIGSDVLSEPLSPNYRESVDAVITLPLSGGTV